MSKIIPMERVVVIEPTKVKAGGIIEYASDKKQEVGKVVAVGTPGYFDNGVKRKAIPLKVGDVVAYRRYGEDKLLLEGKEYLFVGFADILGVIKLK